MLRMKNNRKICLVSLLKLVMLFAVSGYFLQSAETFSTNAYLQSGQMTSAARQQIAAYAREALRAAIDGRAPVAPANLASSITGAHNGADITVIREGKIVAQGYSLTGDNLLNNIRLAAGLAVFGYRVNDFDACTVAVGVLEQGKPSAVPAPMFVPHRGMEAYQIEHSGKNYFVNALSPILQQWNWQKTLESVAASAVPQGNARARLDFLVAPATRLKIYPALTIIAPPLRAGGEVVQLATPLQIPATAQNCQTALTAAGEWWLCNQAAIGAFAETFPAAGEKPEYDLQNNALAAVVLGKLWRKNGKKEFRLAGLKTVDWLLMNYFLESPNTDFGYLAGSDKSVDLAANAAVLWAIAELDAARGNAEIAKYQMMLEKFLLHQRANNGIFQAWPQGSTVAPNSHNFNQTLAIIALLKTAPARHAAAMQQSFDIFVANFAPRTAQRKLPDIVLAPWLTLAAHECYKVSRRNELPQFVQRLHGELAKLVKNWTHADAPVHAQALAAWSFRQSAGMQRLRGDLGAKDISAAQAEKYLGRLIARQIVKGSAWSYLTANPRNFHGGFFTRWGEFSVNIVDMIAATLALAAE